MNFRFSLLLVFIVLAALTRVLPHWPNFTAVGAMALFGAAHFRNVGRAILLPFAALFVSDLYLNNVVYAAWYEGFVWLATPWVYLGFALILGIGFLLRGRVRPVTVLGGALGSSLVFFLVTNLGVWVSSPMYPKSAPGLLAAYTAGLPFLLNTVLANVFYGALFFGAFVWMQERYPALRLAK